MLPPDREDSDQPIVVTGDLVEDPKVFDAQLPGRDGVGPQRLAVPCFHKRLVPQLAPNGAEN